MAGSYHTDERSNISEATALQQDHVFQSIDADLRDFIVKFSEGHTNLASLICDQRAVLKRPSKLLQTLEDIGSFPGVKLCVSNRLDEPFIQGLAMASSLQLRTLTAPDIYRFAVA